MGLAWANGRATDGSAKRNVHVSLRIVDAEHPEQMDRAGRWTYRVRNSARVSVPTT